MASSTWTVVEPSLPALTHTYSFGPGHANALALVVDGGVVVVSPSANPTPELFADLEARGAIKALIAPNAVHTMGVSPWKARYPDAPIFAPAGAIPRIEKTAKVSGIRPLAEAAKLVGDRVELLDMPHYKLGEVLVRWKTEGGWAWFLTDGVRLGQRPHQVLGLAEREGCVARPHQRHGVGRLARALGVGRAAGVVRQAGAAGAGLREGGTARAALLHGRKRSVARMSSCRLPGSKAEWPASGTMRRSASGKARWRAQALSAGQTTS